MHTPHPASPIRPTVAAYYFPGFHDDPRNGLDQGPGFTEWRLVHAARPRFPGHIQPKRPLWGYRDEARVEVMEQNIAAAADHGLDVFLFDWYWYEGAPFLQRPLEEAFLKSGNVGRTRFALMWANHDWVDIFPQGLHEPSPLLHAGAVSAEEFRHLGDYAIEKYFHHPSYWKPGGRPYFSIFQLEKFVEGLGGLEGAAAALEGFRERARAAGFPGLHVNGMVNLWGAPLLPGEPELRDTRAIIDALRLDSLTSYAWPSTLEPEVFPFTDYRRVGERVWPKYDEIARAYPLPYFPNVATGWDLSPRSRQSDPYERWTYPFFPICENNTPDAFAEALARARDWVQAQPQAEKIITINAWNEWTEGSYLEPCEEFGMGRLEAIRAVFGAGDGKGEAQPGA